LIAAAGLKALSRSGPNPRGYNMSAKARIKRAEKAIKPKEQIKIVWLENMTIEGEVIPYTPEPGEKVIDLSHIWDNEKGQ